MKEDKFSDIIAVTKKKEASYMEKNTKITLSVVSFAFYLGFILFVSTHFFDGLSYLYNDQDVVKDLLAFLTIAILPIGVYILVIVMLFKGKKIIQTICTGLLIAFIPVCLLGAFLTMVILTVNGPNGCSYTEDIANYGRYDGDIDTFHFPEEITDEMTVVDFSYFYKFADRDQIDIYLEVKFDDKDTMDKYLSLAKNAFSENGIITYTNPYDPRYTDIVENDCILYSSVDGEFASYIEFEGNENYEYWSVDMYYQSISYSYDDLTIIYNYTSIGNDIMIGNDPDKGEYYPKYLERFGVECSTDNTFAYKL